MKENTLELDPEKMGGISIGTDRRRNSVTKGTEARNKVQIQSWEVNQGS